MPSIRFPRIRPALTLALATLTATVSLAAAPSYVVSGRVLDTKGKPLSGALVWVRPAVTTGLLTVRSNAKGEFKADALPRIPYRTYAYHQVEYGDRLFCLRLAPEAIDQYDSFVPTNEGVQRSFRWKLTGRIMDGFDEYQFFGGEVRLMFRSTDDSRYIASDTAVEVTFTPTGPLIDGSKGETVVKRTKPGNQFLYDIPVGTYRVKAVGVRPDGSREPIAVSQDGNRMGAETDFAFQPAGGCGGSGNGLSRAFLWVQPR